jgi:predicted RND superfamily exporter protein
MNKTHNTNPALPLRIAHALVSWRLPMAWLSVLLCSALASSIPQSRFDTSLDALLTESDPFLPEVELLAEQFPTSPEVRFALTAPVGATAFDLRVINALIDLKSRFEEIPYAERLSSLLDFYSPESQTRLFQNPLGSYSQEDLDALLAPALDDRLLTNSLLTGGGSLTFAVVSLWADDLAGADRERTVTAIAALRDSLRSSHPEVGIYVMSDVILQQASQQAMVDDLSQLMPFVILLCVLVICLCFRSLRFGAGILIHTLATCLCTLGFLAYSGFSFNSISVIAPLIVVIIAVANSVHIISLFRQSLANGAEKFEAMVFSLNHNLMPILLAALTTAIGFVSLLLSSSPAINGFGTIVGIGIGFGFLLTLTFLPALLLLLAPPHDNQMGSERPEDFMTRLLERIINLGATHDRAIFWSFTALGLITFALLPLNESDFNRLDFLGSDPELTSYYEVVGESINRGPLLTYGVQTGAVDGAIKPDFLARLDEFIVWAQALDGVESIASIVDISRAVNRAQHQDNPEFYRIPDTTDAVANSLLAYAVVQSDDFPLRDFITEDFSLTRLFINAAPSTNKELLATDAQLAEEFARRFPEAELLHGSTLLLFSRMDELVTIELLQGYSLSLLLITLCLIVGLRSVKYGLLSIIPNLLPATIVFGIWALAIGQINPFVMMLFSISIGLVVDDSVHLLSHYLQRKREGVEGDAAMAESIRTAGPALSITTLVLALGATVLIGANTLYFQQAAQLLVPIVVLALVLDGLYLPAILRRFP